MAVIWCMRCEGESPSLHVYQLKGSLNSHTMWASYERDWPLMMLWVIHSGEIYCSTSTCNGSERIHTPVSRGNNPVPYPSELSPPPLRDYMWCIMYYASIKIYKGNYLLGLLLFCGTLNAVPVASSWPILHYQDRTQCQSQRSFCVVLIRILYYHKI